jgi:hypothetical protein
MVEIAVKKTGAVPKPFLVTAFFDCVLIDCSFIMMIYLVRD